MIEEYKYYIIKCDKCKSIERDFGLNAGNTIKFDSRKDALVWASLKGYKITKKGKLICKDCQ